MRNLLYPQLSDGLEAAWCPSLGATGYLLPDRSPRGSHGTLTTAPTWEASGGKQSLRFASGSSQYITLPPSKFLLESKLYSFSAWIRMTATGAASAIWGSSNTGTFSDLYFLRSSGDKIQIIESTNANYNPTSTTSLAADTWYHVGVVRTPSGGAFYLNGRLDGTFTNTAIILGSAETGDRIGAIKQSGGQTFYFNGSLDDLRIYRRSLTPSDMALLGTRRGIAYKTRSFYPTRRALADSVTFTSPRIVQRGASSGPLAVSGTYSSASADAVQVKVFLSADDSPVVDWADVDTSLTGGVWSGSVTIPTGGPYYCQARLHDSSNNVLATSSASSSIVCGDALGSFGQSNPDGRGTNNQTYGGSSVAWVVRQSGTIDTTLNDPISDGGNGSFVPLLATLISAHVGASVPIIFVNQTAGGTNLTTDWNPPDGSQWVLADALITNLQLNGVKAALWWQGESEVVAGISQSGYATREQELASYVNAWPGTPELISTLTGQQSTETDADIDAIRFAKIDNWNNGYTAYGANTIDIDLVDGGGDGLHFKSNAELAEVAGRLWLALEDAVYGGTNGRGPRPVTATIDGAVITITVDRDLATATTYTTTAWIVKEAGTPVTVSSVAQTGTREIAITLSAIPAGAITFSFGSGDDAIVADIPRAVSINLPATINGISSVSIPAEPFKDYSATEYIAGSGNDCGQLLFGVQ